MRDEFKSTIFVDSSAFIAGLKSPLGSMRAIFDLFFQGYVSIVISEQVVEETTRNIYEKFPEAIWIMKKILPYIKVIDDPTPKIIGKFKTIIHKNDLPILIAAISIKPDFLITWNTKHFLSSKVKKSAGFIICTPADFLQKYWNK